MKRGDKRAISAIVSTVLVLMLTFGILAFVGPKIITMVKDNLDGSTVCSQVATSLSIVKSDLYTCYVENTTAGGNKTLSLKISYGSKDVNLKRIRIFPHSKGNDYNVTSVNHTSTNKDSFILPGMDSILKINISNEVIPEKVAIMPIVMSGEQERECSKTDYVEIEVC
jgi:hypothetical protein